jgi:hypothetical protein
MVDYRSIVTNPYLRRDMTDRRSETNKHNRDINQALRTDDIEVVKQVGNLHLEEEQVIVVSGVVMLMAEMQRVGSPYAGPGVITHEWEHQYKAEQYGVTAPLALCQTPAGLMPMVNLPHDEIIFDVLDNKPQLLAQFLGDVLSAPRNSLGASDECHNFPERLAGQALLYTAAYLDCKHQLEGSPQAVYILPEEEQIDIVTMATQIIIS